MANNKKIFNPLKLNISELEDSEARAQIEMKFTDYRIQRQLSVETQRKAMIAKLKAVSQESAAQVALTEFLQLAGEYFDEVQTEPLWFAYKSNGDIILESPFTERDMRNGIRSQRAQMEQVARNLEEDSKDHNLYEEGEEE